jgi:CRP-like cAMP-binding protein
MLDVKLNESFQNKNGLLFPDSWKRELLEYKKNEKICKSANITYQQFTHFFLQIIQTVGEGDIVQRLFEISVGRIRIQKGNVVLYRLGAGEVFGELPFLLKTAIGYAVFAEEDCKLYQVQTNKQHIPTATKDGTHLYLLFFPTLFR